MQTRGVLLITGALFLSIAALVLHLWALRSPHWKIIKRDLEPILAPVSYGIWQRCEYTNQSIAKQGVALGILVNVEICRPNRYMRYSPEKFDACYNIRRNCALGENSPIVEGCSCRYLPSAKGLQWLTVLAAICLVSGIPLLYFRVITSPENNMARFVLRLGPFICFSLALLLMITGLILFGAFLRRDLYEDYSFPINVSYNPDIKKSFDLHSLRNYAESHKEIFSSELYSDAVQVLYKDSTTHYHTVIGGATITEIVATVLVLAATILTLVLAIMSRSNDI